MVNPALELERLKYSLRAKNISEQMINDIVNEATNEIDGMIVDAVAEAVSQAVEAGIEKDAYQFIHELRAHKVGNSFALGTDSGRTDFSNPPFPMLPWLLKNPKVAKDGTLYKVIPVGGKSSENKATDITQIQANINETRKQARQRGAMSGGDVFAGAATFSGDFAAQKAASRERSVNAAVKGNTGKQIFRTATSKQDSSKDWVLPAQEKDMSRTLADINDTLKVTIENAIMGVIRFYIESY